MIAPGQTVDDFTLLNDRGEPVRWSDLRGRPVVFFFYPKASTPGCTQEACAFRDVQAEFAALGVDVYGVSADPVAKQARFREKNALSMPLLADPELLVLQAWGIWQKKTLYGREYDGIVRSTFLFDATGTLTKVWPTVKVKGHADDVLNAARALVG